MSEQRSPWLRRGLTIAAMAVAAIGLMTVSIYASSRPAPEAVNPRPGVVSVQAPEAEIPDEIQIGGPFSLVNQDGERVTDADLLGKPVIVFFGFTFCPDACPLALTKARIALDSLGADAETFQTVFITIDPERDTPEQLALYVRSNGFPNGLMGLTGTPDEIKAAADAYRVYYRRVESDDVSAGYLMEHSTVLYLMDSNGRFAGVFSHSLTPDEIADGLRRFLAEG